MKPTDVIVHYVPWRGDQQVSQDEAWILVSVGYEINGHYVTDSVASLVVENGFFTVRLEVPEAHPEIEDFINESNRIFHEGQIAAIRDELTEEDWMEETTDEILVLPVASLEMRERVDSRMFA